MYEYTIRCAKLPGVDWMLPTLPEATLKASKSFSKLDQSKELLNTVESTVEILFAILAK